MLCPSLPALALVCTAGEHYTAVHAKLSERRRPMARARSCSPGLVVRRPHRLAVAVAVKRGERFRHAPSAQWLRGHQNTVAGCSGALTGSASSSGSSGHGQSLLVPQRGRASWERSTIITPARALVLFSPLLPVTTKLRSTLTMQQR